MTRIHCLHGFLGAPGDWDMFETPALRLAPDAILVKPDLFGRDSFPETQTLADWGERYARHVQSAQTNDGNYLLGYSLGGRLALHVALHNPAFWDGVIIIGANPGIDSDEARMQRRHLDEAWAERFETQPWDTLLAAWDAQAVFAGRAAPFARPETAFARPALARALRRWSVGAQTPLWDALPTLTCPVLWIAGAQDMSQKDVCARVQSLLPHAQVWTAAEAGHRVPWEAPHAFAARVRQFVLSHPKIHTPHGVFL